MPPPRSPDTARRRSRRLPLHLPLLLLLLGLGLLLPQDAAAFLSAGGARRRAAPAVGGRGRGLMRLDARQRGAGDERGGAKAAGVSRRESLAWGGSIAGAEAN